MLEIRPTIDAAPLRAVLQGEVVLPGDDGWDAARAAWNLAVDQRPMAVVLAASTEDVQRTVVWAAERDVRIAVQATGHRASALPPLDGSLLLRLDGMTGVEVDPQARTARVLGATPAGVAVAAAAEHGLYPVVGSAPDVSLGGFLLGGGTAFSGRRYGIAANHVRAIELVTARGELVRADAEHEPELFWALRGSGGGLGVVVAVEVDLHPVASAFAGMTMWDVTHAPALLRVWARWCEAGPAEAVTTSFKILHIPDLEQFPPFLRGRSLAVVAGYALDGAADVEPLLGELRGVAEPHVDQWADMPATALQEIHMDPPTPVPAMSTAALLRELPEAAMAAFVAAAPRESALMFAELRQLGGAFARPAERGGVLTAVAEPYSVFSVGVPMVPQLVPVLEGSLGGLREAMAPWASGRSLTTFADHPGTAADLFGPAAAARLRAVRERYDPASRILASHPAA